MWLLDALYNIYCASVHDIHVLYLCVSFYSKCSMSICMYSFHCTRLQITDATPVSSAALSYCTLQNSIFFMSLPLTCCSYLSERDSNLSPQTRPMAKNKPDMSVHTS